MARNQIRIDGDFSGLVKGMGRITNEFKKLNKISIKLDDKDVKKFNKFNIDSWRDLNRDIDKYQTKLERLHKIKVISGKLSDVQQKQESVLNNLVHKRTQELEKQNAFYQKGNLLQRAGTRIKMGAEKGDIKDTIGDALSSMGGAMGMLPGIGTALSAGLGVYAGARALTAPRRALAGQNLQFMGLNRGAVSQDRLEELRQSGIESGYTAQESMTSAVGLQRNAGNVRGREDLQNLFNLSRQTGMGTEELTQYAGTFRQAAVTPQGANLLENIEKTRDLYKQAMISALDSSGAIKFMQTTAEMTDQIANEGSADIDSIKNTLSSLALSSEFYKANSKRAEVAMKGAESFFKSSSGTGLAMRALQASGMATGMSAPEMLLMQRKGFTEKGGIGEKGLTAIVKQIAAASAGIPIQEGRMTQKEFGKINPSQKASAALSMSQQFGITPTNAEALLKASLTGTKISDKELKDMFEDDNKKMVNLQGSIDMRIKHNEAQFQELLLDIGEKILPLTVKMEEHLYDLVDHFVGNQGPKSERILNIEAQQAAQTAEEEKGTVIGAIKNLFGMGSEEKAQESLQTLAKEKMSKGKNLNPDEAYSFVRGRDMNEQTYSNLKGMQGDFGSLKNYYDAQMSKAEKIKDPTQQRQAIEAMTPVKNTLDTLATHLKDSTVATRQLLEYIGKQPAKNIKSR